MPMYEFLCTDCGATVPVRATLAEKEAGLEPECHMCGSRAVRRAFSPVAIGGRETAPAGGGGCCGGACGCG